MSPAKMLVGWVVPWLVLYFGLSIEVAGVTTGYHYRFVSETEVKANFSIVLPSPAQPRSERPFCSTWGNYHFKTFDGRFLHLPSSCSYTFVRHCKGSYRDFDITVQREQTSGVPVVQASLTLDGLSVKLSQSSISVANKP